MTTKESIERLRELAERATPGPWHCDAVNYPDDVSIWAGGEKDDWIANIGYPITAVGVVADVAIADGNFIAEANPAAILQLLAEIDRLRYAYKSGIDMFNELQLMHSEALTENAKLQVEVDRLRKENDILYSDSERWHMHLRLVHKKHGARVVREMVDVVNAILRPAPTGEQK